MYHFHLLLVKVVGLFCGIVLSNGILLNGNYLSFSITRTSKFVPLSRLWHSICINKGTMKHFILILLILLFIGCGSGNSNDDKSLNNQTLNNQTPLTVAPGNLVALGNNHKILLSWDPVEGASSYNIYYSDTPNVDTSTGIKIPSVYSPYTHSNLDGKKVYYIVTAVSTSEESLPSLEASATPANIFLDKESVNVLDDNGWLVILGSVKNWGDIPACESTIIATLNLLTQKEVATVNGDVIGKTMKRAGFSDSACLYPGENGVFQIYAGIPYTIYKNDGPILEIEATTVGIEEPVIRDTDLIVEDGSLKWESEWESDDTLEKITGTIKNTHENATAYVVIVNFVTYDEEDKITGIYPGLASDGPCQELEFTDYSCIPADKSAFFSIMPWRLESFSDINEAPSYSIFISHLEKSDFLAPAE